MGMGGGGVAGRPGRHTNSVYDMSGTFCFLLLEYALICIVFMVFMAWVGYKQQLTQLHLLFRPGTIRP